MTANRVVVVDGNVTRGDEVYIAVCDTGSVSEIFSIMSLEKTAPRKYYVKKMIVNMFDNHNIWLNEPGSDVRTSTESDRIYIDKKLALRVAREYQEIERTGYINLADMAKEMVEELQKEIDNS